MWGAGDGFIRAVPALIFLFPDCEPLHHPLDDLFELHLLQARCISPLQQLFIQTFHPALGLHEERPWRLRVLLHIVEQLEGGLTIILNGKDTGCSPQCIKDERQHLLTPRLLQGAGNVLFGFLDISQSDISKYQPAARRADHPLIFATLHTNSSSQTLDRIIDVFPETQQQQVRAQLSNILQAVVAQRLIPLDKGGRRAVSEIMIMNSAVGNLIREGKTHQIDNVIRTSSDLGMVSLEKALVNLVREGVINVQKAQEYAVFPEEVLRLLKA